MNTPKITDEMVIKEIEKICYAAVNWHYFSRYDNACVAISEFLKQPEASVIKERVRDLLVSHHVILKDKKLRLKINGKPYPKITQYLYEKQLIDTAKSIQNCVEGVAGKGKALFFDAKHIGQENIQMSIIHRGIKLDLGNVYKEVMAVSGVGITNLTNVTIAHFTGDTPHIANNSFARKTQKRKLVI